MRRFKQLGLYEMNMMSHPGKADTAAGPAPSQRRVIQDLLLAEGLWASKRAGCHDSLERLERDIFENLKQQSEETRRRYVSSIVRWFFPGRQLASPASQVWKAYEDEGLTLEILRVLYLKAEPIVGRCVDEFLYPIQENAAVPASYLDSYLISCLGNVPKKTRGRLKQNLRKLGFLAKFSPGRDLLRPLAPSGTAMFLLFTYYFACEEPRTVEVPTMLADPFWKYLGYKSDEAVRKAFREATDSGLLGKYVIADRLELVTTTSTFAQCLEKRVRL